MAWWKRTKAKKSSLISDALLFTDDAYAKFVADFVDQLDSATRAHVAVAYQNLVPIVSALYNINKERGEKFTIEIWIRQLELSLDDPDEINSRRYSWFLFASLIARLEKIAQKDEALVSIGAAIWTIIATEYPRLKILLPNNIVWKDEEKEWFDLEQSDSEMIQDAVNNHIPPKFAAHSITEAFARDQKLLYWPSKYRVGFIP